MDLISKDKALMCATGCFPVDSERADECRVIAKRLSDCPSAFEGMTCGEIIEALFPIERIYKEEYVEVVFKSQYHTTYFTFDFWNSTYQKGK